MDAANKPGVMSEAPAAEPEFSGFTMRSGNTTFVVGLHFSETSKETLEDKVKRLVKKEADPDPDRPGLNSKKRRISASYIVFMASATRKPLFFCVLRAVKP